MKKVEGIVKPFRLEEVQDALRAAGTQGITVTDVLSGGVGLVPRVKIETVVPDGLVRRIADAFGDGNANVIDVDEAIRIRTGERGPSAV